MSGGIGNSGGLVEILDGPQVDAFGRFRSSEASTLFDSKFLFDKQPIIWDEVITDSSGNATSTHTPADASIALYVEADDEIIRQTFERFTHQPGKSTEVLMTVVIGTGATGVIKRFGYFDENNGLFLEQSGTDLRLVIRKDASDTVITRSAWDDPLDGTGRSGINLNVINIQLFSIDFQWLGTGRIRFGFYNQNKLVIFHSSYHANLVTSVYMSIPNLPIRYEISSTSGSATLIQICSSVMVEGRDITTGILRTASRGGTAVAATVAGTVYANVGIRLKADHIGAIVIPIEFSILAQNQNSRLEYLILLNPTVAGTFTYGDITNSAVQRALGATANTVTGGTQLITGFTTNRSGSIRAVGTFRALGAAIDGTVDELVLCTRPLSANQNHHGSLTWRELR